MMLTTSDFDFDLPSDLIASHPLSQRDASRMLVVKEEKTSDKHIRDFLDYLQPGDVVVFNNSRVIPARFIADGKYEIIEDRKDAIFHALDIAKEGDIILLAGKGQETYLDVKGIKTHFDEREVVNSYFER